MTAPVDRLRSFGEATRGHRVAADEQLEGLDVRLGEAQADGDRLAEDLPLEVDLAERADDGVDARNHDPLDNRSLMR